MAEWSNAADSKSVIGLVPIWGSNPHLSAKIFKKSIKKLLMRGLLSSANLSLTMQNKYVLIIMCYKETNKGEKCPH